MNTTTLTELRELLERLIPLLQEDVVTLQQETSGQGPLTRRLLQREIQEREALVPQLQEAVKQLSIEQNESWTVERFKKELLDSERYRNHYESQNQTEKLCQFGVDLMNLTQRERWQLTPKFNKNYFALYFKERRVFGVHLRGNKSALLVWFPKDVRAQRNNPVFDHQYTCDYWDSERCGMYPGDVTVENIKDVLEFAYLWHANQKTS